MKCERPDISQGMLQSLPQRGRSLVALARLIQHMKVGDRLPTQRELSERLDVSRPTLGKGVELLCKVGILKAIPGSGTFLQRSIRPDEAATLGIVSTLRGPSQLGVIVPSISHSVIARIVCAIEQAAAELDMQILLAHDHKNLDLHVKQIQQLARQDLAGLIIYPDHDLVSRPAYHDLLNQLVADRKPVMLIDRYIPEVNLPCVMTDHVQGQQAIVEHLILAGRRRLALISWPEASGVAYRDHMRGLTNALKAQGLDPAPWAHAKLTYGAPLEMQAMAAVDAWLKQYPHGLPFDAIVCFQDAMAYGAYQALQRAGLRVPEDVALTGYGDQYPHIYQAAGLALTTVAQPLDQIGELAVKRLCQPQTDGDIPFRQLLQPRLVIRQSCGHVSQVVH
jgi:DNA-binding LacI/PurR family transcriptional regulator